MDSINGMEEIMTRDSMVTMGMQHHKSSLIRQLFLHPLCSLISLSNQTLNFPTRGNSLQFSASTYCQEILQPKEPYNILENWSVTCSGLDNLSELLWQRYRSHISGLAEVDESDPPKYSCIDVPPTIENINHYIIFKKSNRYFMFGPAYGITLDSSLTTLTTAILQNWSSPRGRGQPGPITLYIFQYGQNLKTSSQYALFETKCLQPQAVDRAGAPAQSIQTEIAERLKTLHSNTFDVTTLCGPFGQTRFHVFRSLSKKPQFKVHQCVRLFLC
ncbi:hypothetical protein BC829DRAFT_419770 [Chytridium lagenaria]|nr:hypothetical protein BC829DRAFT_419770 [Chytridium lagenaria]